MSDIATRPALYEVSLAVVTSRGAHTWYATVSSWQMLVLIENDNLTLIVANITLFLILTDLFFAGIRS